MVDVKQIKERIKYFQGKLPLPGEWRTQEEREITARIQELVWVLDDTFSVTVTGKKEDVKKFLARVDKVVDGEVKVVEK